MSIIRRVRFEGESNQPEPKEEEEKDENPLVSLLQKYVETRDNRLEIERAVKSLKQSEDLLEEQIWNTMEAYGFSSIKTDEFGTVVRTFNRNFNITDFRTYREWCRDSDNYNLLREEIHKSNLRDFCNERIKDGVPEAIPPGVEMVIDKIIQIRGRRKGADTDEAS